MTVTFVCLLHREEEKAQGGGGGGQERLAAYIRQSSCCGMVLMQAIIQQLLSSWSIVKQPGVSCLHSTCEVRNRLSCHNDTSSLKLRICNNLLKGITV